MHRNERPTTPQGAFFRQPPPRKGTPRFTLRPPQNPLKTLKFRSKFKVCVCLTVCNHACTTLPRAGRPSLYIPRIPSHPLGALSTQKSTPHVPQNTRGVHIYSLIAAAGTPRSWYRQPPAWVHVGSPAKIIRTRQQSSTTATVRPPPSRHSPAHQCPQYGCAPSDPASTTDADAATSQPRRAYPSPPDRPVPGS